MNRSPAATLKVVVMHAEPLVAVGLVAALRQQPGFEVFVHGVDMLCDDQFHIDVVVADYGSAQDLLSASRSLSACSLSGAKVMVLTVRDRENDIRLALQCGVHGYLLSGCSIEELAEGVRMLARDAHYLCGTAMQRLADSLCHESLTVREVDVLHLVAGGDSNKVIARELAIAVGTVKAHVTAIMGKLGASCRTDAARIAAERGLVDGQLSATRRHHRLPVPNRESPSALFAN